MDAHAQGENKPQDGAQVTQKPTQDEIAALLKSLDAPAFATREAAFERLRLMGPKIHDILISRLDKLSINARMQVQSLLEESASDKKAYIPQLSPSMLTIGKEKTTVGDILRLLSQDAGFRFADRVGINERNEIFLPEGKREALKILHELCNKLGVRWAQDYNTGEFRFYNSGIKSAPVEIYSGPFRVALNSMTINTNLQFGSDATFNCYIRGQLDIEPTADVLGVVFQPQVTEAKDDKGRSVKIETSVAQSFQSSLNRRVFNFNLRIERPQKDASSLKTLNITIPIVVPTGIETVEVALDAENDSSKAQSGSLEVQFKRIEKNAQRRTAVLRVSRILPRTKTVRPMEIIEQLVTFVAEDGSEKTAYKRIARQIQGDHEVLRVELPKGEFKSLRFSQVVSVGSKTLEFKFVDVPLP